MMGNITESDLKVGGAIPQRRACIIFLESLSKSGNVSDADIALAQQWLSKYGDLIEQIMSHELAMSVMAVVRKEREVSVSELAKMFNRVESPIRNWLNNFLKAELIEKRKTKIGRRRVFYRVADKNRFIIDGILDSIVQERGREWDIENTSQMVSANDSLQSKQNVARRKSREKKRKLSLKKSSKSGKRTT